MIANQTIMATKTILLLGSSVSAYLYLTKITQNCNNKRNTYSITNSKDANMAVGEIISIEYDKNIVHLYNILIDTENNFQSHKEYFAAIEMDCIKFIVTPEEYKDLQKWYQYATKIINKKIPHETYLIYRNTYPKGLIATIVNTSIVDPIIETPVVDPMIELSVTEVIIETSVLEPMIEASVTESIIETSVTEPIIETSIEESTQDSLFNEDLNKLIQIIPHRIPNIFLADKLNTEYNIRVRTLARKINNILCNINDSNIFTHEISLEGMNVFSTKKLLIEYFKIMHPYIIITNVTNDKFTINL